MSRRISMIRLTRAGAPSACMYGRAPTVGRRSRHGSRFERPGDRTRRPPGGGSAARLHGRARLTREERRRADRGASCRVCELSRRGRGAGGDDDRPREAIAAAAGESRVSVWCRHARGAQPVPAPWRPALAVALLVALMGADAAVDRPGERDDATRCRAESRRDDGARAKTILNDIRGAQRRRHSTACSGVAR